MVAVTDLKIGRKYDFEGFALEDGSHPSYIEMGVANWSGWLLGITPNNDDASWTLFLKDDEGCEFYISIGPGVYNIFQHAAAQKIGDDLTNVFDWICNLDESN